MCHSCTHQERNNFLEANRIITYLQDKMEFCGDFASIFDFCVDFAAIFEPKSWSQANKLDLVFLKLKNRKPLYLLGFSEISSVFLLGCPDGLEPSTFRTTSRFPNSPGLPLSIGVYVNHKNRVCADFAPISTLQ